MVVAASPATSPMATTRSPSIATSARRRALPLPSTRSPPLIRMSYMPGSSRWVQVESGGSSVLSRVMDLSEGLRSTGAVRDFTDDPVPDDVVYRLLETARFAPNGGNRQAWHVIVVRDPATRVALRDLYLPGWYEYLPQMEAGLTPFAAVTDRDAETTAR